MADPSTSCASNIDPSTAQSASNVRVDVKEKRKVYLARRDASKIYLFDAFEQWRAFKDSKNLKTDKDVAFMLLAFYQTQEDRLCASVETQTDQEGGDIPPATPTTPRRSARIRQREFSSPGNLSSPLFTSTPRPHGETEGAMKAPKRIHTSLIHSSTPPSKRSLLSDSSPLSAISAFSQRDLFREETLTANEHESDSESEYNDDTTLTASTIMPMDKSVDLSSLDTSCIEDEVFNVEIGGYDDEELARDEKDNTSSVQRVSVDDAIKQEKCIVFTNALMSLLKELHGSICKQQGCGRVLVYNKSYVGTCLTASWRCASGHKGGRWAAQPMCENLRAGNLLLASALLLSGNSYTKVGMMFRFLKLQYFSKTLFTQYQSLYIAPAVNEFWDDHKQKLWEEKAGKDILLSGDGRNDSPGHCAQYATYSLADMVDNAILQMNIVDVREAAGKSTNMEQIGFVRGMHQLLSSPMKIKEVVTDGHLGIAALMKTDDKYKDVLHQHDIWHGGKSLTKKINAAAKTKPQKDLAPWAPSIRNHFWYCAKHCDKDVKNIKDKWVGILHHVANEHEWIIEEGDNKAKCDHGPIADEEQRERPWLKKGSAPHKALTKIVMDKRLLNTFRYYTHFRHTGFLESFHNHILMYAPKRQSYTFVGYRLRNQLAAIDYNHHREREIATTADGRLRMERKYSKRTKQWSAVKVLEPKQYTYIPNLLGKIFGMRASTKGGVNKKIVVLEEDPKRIAPNISAVPPPPVASLVETHKSRF